MSIAKGTIEHNNWDEKPYHEAAPLKSSEANCVVNPAQLASGTASGPATSISVAQLRATGQSDLAVADLNLDGVIDQKDIAAWLQGARPAKPISGGTRR